MNILAKTKNHSAYPRNSAGIALFEILIALLVLSVGLLGLATLQSQGLRSSSSATMRTEATFLAMDITDRMRASMTPAPPAPPAPPILAPGYINTWNALPGGCVPGAGGATPAQDVCDWTSAIQTQLGGGQPGSWQATILAAPAPAPAGALIVTIMWDDERQGVAGTGCGGNPAVDMTCFQTLFQP